MLTLPDEIDFFWSSPIFYQTERGNQGRGRAIADNEDSRSTRINYVTALFLLNRYIALVHHITTQLLHLGKWTSQVSSKFYTQWPLNSSFLRKPAFTLGVSANTRSRFQKKNEKDRLLALRANGLLSFRCNRLFFMGQILFVVIEVIVNCKTGGSYWRHYFNQILFFYLVLGVFPLELSTECPFSYDNSTHYHSVMRN